MAVLFLGYELGDSFGWRQKLVDIGAANVNPRHEAIGRTRLLASFLPFILAATLIMLHFAHEYLTFMGPQMRRRLGIAMAIYLALAFVSFLPQLWGSSPADAPSLGRGFLNAAFGQVPATSGGMEWAVRLTGEKVPLVALLHVLVFVFSIFLLLGAGSAIMGTISSVARARRDARGAISRSACADIITICSAPGSTAISTPPPS